MVTLGCCGAHSHTFREVSPRPRGTRESLDDPPGRGVLPVGVGELQCTPDFCHVGVR